MDAIAAPSSGLSVPPLTAPTIAPSAPTMSPGVAIDGNAICTVRPRGGQMRSKQIFNATTFPFIASAIAFRVSASPSPSNKASTASVTLCRAPGGRPGLPTGNGRPRVVRAFLRGPTIASRGTHAAVRAMQRRVRDCLLIAETESPQHVSQSFGQQISCVPGGCSESGQCVEIRESPCDSCRVVGDENVVLCRLAIETHAIEKIALDQIERQFGGLAIYMFFVHLLGY